MPTTLPNSQAFRPIRVDGRACLVGLLILLITLVGSCSRQANPSPEALTLYILSPHGTEIRREFAQAFSAWHQKHYGVPVAVQWTDIGSGGTGTIAKYLETLYRTSETSGNDVVFGGGSAQFAQYAAAGFLVAPLPLEAGDPVFKEDPIEAVPGDLFGQPLKHPQKLWIAATLASFGIQINKDRIAELGLTTPRTWEDIATPAWLGRLSLADPSKSGSVKTSYEQVFQQHGWEKGWAILTRIFANADVIRDGGSNPAEDVGSAEAVGGIVIDFYGRIHITRAGSSFVGFVIPEGGSALDGDPIGILKGAPHAEVAARFVRFVVSREGQRLWTFKPGVAGGPRKAALGRLSVLPGLYHEEPEKMLDATSPFELTGAARPLKTDARAQSVRNRFLGELIKSTLIDNHAQLVETRRAMVAAGDPPALLAKLEAPPVFSPAQVDAAGALVFGPPETITEARQGAVAEDFMPPAGSEKSRHIERLQTHLRDQWRDTHRARLLELRAATGSAIMP